MACVGGGQTGSETAKSTQPAIWSNVTRSLSDYGESLLRPAETLDFIGGDHFEIGGGIGVTTPEALILPQLDSAHRELEEFSGVSISLIAARLPTLLQSLGARRQATHLCLHKPRAATQP